MAVLAILQPDARAAARLTDALMGAHDVRVCTTWDALEKLLVDATVDACLIDADHPDRARASNRIIALRDSFPDLAIVAWLESDDAGGYFGLGGLGVDGVVVAGVRSTRVRADIDTALSTARAKQVERKLLRRITQPGPAAIAWAMEHAGTDTSVERLATALGYTPRGLRDALQEASLPTPARVLLWGRLILAGARLAEGRTVEDVAFSLGYSTSTSLARAMKLHTGLTPAGIARDGDMWTVQDSLLPVDPEQNRGGSGSPRPPLVRLSGLAFAAALAGCATIGLGGSGIDRGAINGAIESAPLDQLHIGVYVVDAKSGRSLFARNARRKFVPASNQKILVTATALSLLGPDYRFRTEVWATGPIGPNDANDANDANDGSYLDGDLVLVGSGDPSLSDRYWPSGTSALKALADSLRATGLQHVAGSAFIDVSAWDSTTVGPTWEVEDLRYAYGSTGGAFAIDEGEIEVVVEAGPAVGSPALVRWTPVGTDDFVRSRVRTSAPDSSTRILPSYLPESRQLVLEGNVEWGTVDTLSFALRDPVRQAAAVFRNALGRAGIELEGGWEVKWAPGERVGRGCLSGQLEECGHAGLIVAIESPPLSELVAGILKPSQNWMTEQLVRTLGARYGVEGSWEEGVGVVEAYLINELGVDSLDIAARDGSGLSAYNLVTPRALVHILREMSAGPHAVEYRTAMAEPGEEESTLEERLLGLEGRLFAKTGTISNVNSLSGYLVRDNGQEVVFSILTNGSGLPSSRVRTAIDEIVRHLAR